MGVLFLNHQNQLIAFEELFYGTLNMCAVHPREIIKRALALNAAAVVLAHNHPSGCPAPSDTDIQATQEIKKALFLIDVQLLDHIIVASGKYVSFVKKGLL